VVQRLPDYVDLADPSAAPPGSATNQRFGRRFQVVQLRWLTAEEI